MVIIGDIFCHLIIKRLNQYHRMNSLVTTYLNGIGQIMLQGNKWTGLVFFIGILYSSTILGIATALAVLVGSLTAHLLKYDKDEIHNGLYGFSPALVGIGLVVFFNPEPLVWLSIIIGSVLAAIIQHTFFSFKIPGYTFPFIVVTWVFIYLLKYFLNIPSPTLPIETNQYIFETPLNGYSQVMFINNYITGVLFFIAVFISSPRAALFGLIGALVAGFIAFLFHSSSNDINNGIYSFNAVLCAIALADYKRTDILYVLLSIILSVLIQLGMQEMKLIALTFPFVLSVWITLIIKNLLSNKYANHALAK